MNKSFLQLVALAIVVLAFASLATKSQTSADPPLSHISDYKDVTRPDGTDANNLGMICVGGVWYLSYTGSLSRGAGITAMMKPDGTVATCK
jgi:hypothetical protein